jgi:hypothetical protein
VFLCSSARKFAILYSYLQNGFLFSSFCSEIRYSVFKRFSVETAVDKFIIAGEKMYLAHSRENMHFNLFPFSVSFCIFHRSGHRPVTIELLRLRFFRMKVNEVLVFSLSHQFKNLILALLLN